jgi:hypothetical protein
MTDLEGFELQRYARLVERELRGLPLSADERAFVQRMTREHPVARMEAELLDELAVLDAPPGASADTRALVDAALAALPAAQAKAEHDELVRLRRSGVPRWIWISGACAAAAVAVASLVLPAQKHDAPITKTAPAPRPSSPETRVELVYASGHVRVDGAAARSAQLLDEGSVVTVQSGIACIAMDPGIDLCTSEKTELRFTRTRSPLRRVDLLEGKVAARLSPQPQGSQLSIVAGDVFSTALGTAFTVEIEAERGVQTTVLEGKVRVGNERGREQIVLAHQRAVSKADGTAEVTAVGRQQEAPAWAMLSPARLWSLSLSATLEVSGLEQAPEASVELDGQAIGVAPLSTVIPAGTHELSVRAGNRVLLQRELVAEAGEHVEIELTPSLLEVKIAEVAPARTARTSARGDRQAAGDSDEPSASDLLGAARHAMRGGDFAQAARDYEALRAAQPASPEARAVLLSLAELELEHLGEPRRALYHAEQYLRGGVGPLVPEARELRVRALGALGRHAEERVAIEELLARHPEHLRAAALTRRLQELGSRSGAP